MKQQQKRLAILLCLAGALGFTAFQLRSAFGGPADAPAPSETPMTEAGDEVPADSTPTDPMPVEAEPSLKSSLDGDHWVIGNPFAELARAKEELDAARGIIEASSANSVKPEVGAGKRPNSPHEGTPVDPILTVRALVEAGPRSTALVGRDLVSIGEVVPGSAWTLVNISNGQAQFRNKDKTVTITPRASGASKEVHAPKD